MVPGEGRTSRLKQESSLLRHTPGTEQLRRDSEGLVGELSVLGLWRNDELSRPNLSRRP